MSVGKEIIYETPDVEYESESQLPQEAENVDIERIHLDLDKASKIFAGKYITCEGADFTHNGSRKLKGYNTGAYILEYVGSKFPEPETVDQKFNRLQMEFLELKDEIENKQDEKQSNLSVTKEHIAGLSKQLEQIILAKTVAVQVKDHSNVSKTEKSGETPSHVGRVNLDSVVISDFEARLNRLEKVLGSVDIATGSPVGVSGSVTEAIDDLKTRVDCLNPTLLEAAENRLNAVLGKQNEEKKTIDAFAERVDEVYKLISNFQNSSQLVNNVVNRLKGLASLHEQAADFSSKLNELHGAKKEITENMDNNRKALEEFGEQCRKAVDDLRKEIEQSKRA